MNTVATVGFVVLKSVAMRGVLIGLVYGLLAFGLVLVFRANGIVNFAHGEIGVFAAAVFLKLSTSFHFPYWIGFLVAIAVGALAGGLAEVLVVRRLRDAPRLMSVVATLGLGQFLALAGRALSSQQGTQGNFPSPPGFPTFRIDTFFVSRAYSAILIVTPLLLLTLAVMLRRSRAGLALRAAADNPDAARMAGVYPGRMSSLAWALAGGVSAYTALLVIPAQGYAGGGGGTAPALLLRALAVAVIARMVNLPFTLVAGIALGILEAILQFNYPSGGPVEMVLFVVILLSLLSRSKHGGRRADRSWRSIQAWPPMPIEWRTRPAVRRAAWVVAVVGLVCGVVAGMGASNESASVLTSILLFALVGVSVFIITALGGQLSLGQFAVAGIGATAAVRIAERTDSMPLAILGAGFAGAIAATIVGLPALRLRGLMLAVTTLGFAIAVASWLLPQPWMLGSGRAITNRRLFGIELDRARSFYWVAFAAFVLVLLGVRNLARSGYGRRLIALRDNEDQARAFSVSAVRTSLTGFALSGFVAGIGGGLYAYSVSRSIVASNFLPDDSIQVAATAVLGGLGLFFGPLLGALYIFGVPRWLPLDSAGLAASSLGWLVLILYFPNGLAGVIAPIRLAILRLLARKAPAEEPAPPTAGTFDRVQMLERVRSEDRRSAVANDEQPLLVVENVSKRFGGLVAVNDVSFEVHRGEILALIGPNGAGKTTLFEILGGFNKADSGRVSFEGVDITREGPEARARRGLIRSFQDAPLFATMTVSETVQLAGERRAPSRLLPSVLGLRSADSAKQVRADELIELMGLERYARTPVHQLSTGTRRIAELACVIALDPTLLLLDEPASGIAQRETEALGRLLRQVKDHLGTTMVLIEHDIPMVRSLADRVVAMEAGTVLCVGTPESVFADERVVAAYLGGDVVAIERSDELVTT